MTGTNLRPFRNGVSGNPGGRPKLPIELRTARRENMSTLIKLIHQYAGMSEENACQRLSRPDVLQTEKMIQGQISKAKEGDTNAFKFIIEVMCGKIPEFDEMSIAETMTSEEKLAAMKKAVELLEIEVRANARNPTDLP